MSRSEAQGLLSNASSHPVVSNPLEIITRPFVSTELSNKKKADVKKMITEYCDKQVKLIESIFDIIMRKVRKQENLALITTKSTEFSKLNKCIAKLDGCVAELNECVKLYEDAKGRVERTVDSEFNDPNLENWENSEVKKFLNKRVNLTLDTFKAETATITCFKKLPQDIRDNPTIKDKIDKFEGTSDYCMKTLPFLAGAALICFISSLILLCCRSGRKIDAAAVTLLVLGGILCSAIGNLNETSRTISFQHHLQYHLQSVAECMPSVPATVRQKHVRNQETHRAEGNMYNADENNKYPAEAGIRNQ